MPYSDQDGSWYSDRLRTPQGDTWKASAERLAAAVESFLYDVKSPAYGNVSQLSWHISAYDVDKIGSGHSFNQTPYDPAQAALVHPAPHDSSDDAYEGYPGYPADAKLSDHINTGPTDPGASAPVAVVLGAPPVVEAPAPAPVVAPVDPAPAAPAPAAPVVAS